MANSNLYPPIVAHSMPAFAIEGSDTTVRVYFALSSFNSRSDFKSAHVTVRYQQNNANALSDAYPAQIKVTAVNEVTAEEDAVIAASQTRYYIEISSSDLADGFIVDTTYKVQIRFSDLESQSSGPTMDYFTSNLNHFSEWSTVCLIRGITKPKFFIIGLEEDGEDDASTEVELTLSSVDSSFIVSYTPGSKEETLRRWNVGLYTEQEELIVESGWVAFDSYNNIILEDNGSVYFETVLPYQMSNEGYYYVYVTIETKNGYTKTRKVKFQCAVNQDEAFDGSIDCYIVEEEGYAQVDIIGDSPSFIGSLTLRRSSSESNFTVWEDIANNYFVSEKVNWSYCDFTIESGVWYLYGVQTRDTFGRRGALKTIHSAQMGEFEDAFLVEKSESLSNAKQLKLRYDFKINNFVRTVAESKTDTIGSQYPFVRRNGNMYYREMQCTGLITAYMDANAHLFTTDAELYHNNQDRYSEIQQAINLYVNQYDYTYEREFREAVEEFLHNGKVKLFKSLQEGNMLVKVMNVTLTPKQELGRLLYEFSATFVEVDEPSILNLQKHGLISIGNYNPNITWSETNLLGRLGSSSSASHLIPAGTNIMNQLKDMYDNKAPSGEVVNDFYLTHLRLEFESEPYLIKKGRIPSIVKTEGQYYYEPGADEPRQKADSSDEIYNSDEYLLGWMFLFGNQYIIVEPPNNIYELKGPNVHISSGTQIVPCADTEMQVDFVINTINAQDVSRMTRKKIYRRINGQYINTFKSDEDIYKTLWYRYYIDYYDEGGNDSESNYYTQVISVLTMDIEAEPGAIIQVRSDAEGVTGLSTFIVNETGRYFLDPGSEEYSIVECYIKGMRIDARYLLNKGDARNFDDMNNTGTGMSIETWNQIHNLGDSAAAVPVEYDYYTADGKSYMFYRGKWYPVTIQQINGINTIFDVDCPVDAIIYYYVLAVKGIY